MKFTETLKRLFAGGREFRWQGITVPASIDIERFIAATSPETKNIPLAIALQVHDAIEARFTDRDTGKMDALEMAEMRGGIKALKTFAQLYDRLVFAKERAK